MSAWCEAAAVAHLRRGHVLAHATEGVIGLAGLAVRERTCHRIARLKRRAVDKPFIVVAADFTQIRHLLSCGIAELGPVQASWPGPETWVFEASPDAPPWLVSNTGTIALRLTAHRQFAALCRRVGPLISTSANPLRARPARTLAGARGYFRFGVDYYLPGRLQAPGRVSRIREVGSFMPIRG